MGNRQSHEQSEEFMSASRRFSEAELRELKALFNSLAAQSRSDGKYVIASVLQAYYKIHGSLGSRLFDLITGHRQDQCLYYEDLVIAKGIYEKGSPEEVEGFLYKLVDVLGDGLVQRSEVEAVVLSVIETVLGLSTTLNSKNIMETSIGGFLNSAQFSLKSNDESEPCMSAEDFRVWCNLVPSIKKFLCSLMSTPMSSDIGTGVVGRKVPILRVERKMEVSPILQPEHAWHICGALQQQDAQEWNLLYHSSVHGFSFNTFLSNVTLSGESTVLVIKDKEGFIYGGYASQPWERHAEFYGDMKSFIFSLYPRAAIYRPSGANHNLQWCAVSFSSESIPNGVGFGGQAHHFGIYLSASFEQGQAFPSVTFNNPCLSKEGRFVPDTVECWGVMMTKGEDGLKGKGTVLDRFKEDRNMLNLVGIANASESV